MRGSLEIYKEGQLIHKEPNMVLDAAGDILADIMVIPAQVSSVAAASSILDTSNYTVNAISFAPTIDGFIGNAHNVTNTVIRDGAQASGIFSIFGDHVVVGYTSATTQSAIEIHNTGFSATNPIDKKLLHEFEYLFDETKASGAQTKRLYDPRELPKKTGIISFSYQLIGKELGHHPNFIQYFADVPTNKQIVASRTPGETLPNNDDIANVGVSRAYGAWPAASGTDIVVFFQNALLTPITTSPLVVGEDWIHVDPGFNEVSSMDFRGYVRAYQLSEEQDPASGLITSSTATFSATGEVTYHLTIASGDLAICQFFGGIFKLGLWALDLSSTLANIDDSDNTVQAPFDWIDASGVTQREFRLITKKQLTSNIAHFIDPDSAIPCWDTIRPLTLIWRLQFT